MYFYFLEGHGGDTIQFTKGPAYPPGLSFSRVPHLRNLVAQTPELCLFYRKHRSIRHALRFCAAFGLIAEVLGAPFLMEDPANQFLRLKRQVIHLQDFWDPDHHPDGKGTSLADEVLVFDTSSPLW